MLFDTESPESIPDVLRFFPVLFVEAVPEGMVRYPLRVSEEVFALALRNSLPTVEFEGMVNLSLQPSPPRLDPAVKKDGQIDSDRKVKEDSNHPIQMQAKVQEKEYSHDAPLHQELAHYRRHPTYSLIFDTWLEVNQEGIEQGEHQPHGQGDPGTDQQAGLVDDQSEDENDRPDHEDEGSLHAAVPLVGPSGINRISHLSKSSLYQR